MSRSCSSLLVMVLLCFFSAPVEAALYYVNRSAAGNNDGGSWENAFVGLQNALAAASSGDQIWVAAGTYYPGATRSSSFQMKNGVALYGGFSGVEASLDERNPAAHETILSGDIGVTGDAADNCYHVFYHPSGTGLDNTAVLDGFTIADGNADGGYPHNHGAGMSNDHSAPTLTNCVFRNNAAAGSGGGMYNSSASPVLAACRFIGNTAANGGGMFNNFSSPVAVTCIFSGNTSASGGAMKNVASSPNLAGCTFSANTAATSGGAMANAYNTSQPVITHCILWGNNALVSGSQIHNESSSAPVIRHSSIANSGGSGAAWNTALGIDGGGNIEADPLFLRNPNPGDDGAWGTGDDDFGDLHLTGGSPCIDAGDPSASNGTDMDGESRVSDGDCDGAAVVDMGADERVDGDCDGLSDHEEAILGTNPSVSDTDGDGLSDGGEINTHGTDPLDADTDDDGLTDGEEILTHGTDPAKADTDGDGLSDYAEINAHGTDPLACDTDGDGLDDDAEVNIQATDPLDADTDDDGLTDGEEANTYGTDPLDADMDGDGLTDGEEILTYGTAPGEADTDGDGYSDHMEIYHGADPLSGSATPGPVVIYVDDDAGGANSGKSWSHAFTDLQDALRVALSGDEIRVAAGVYYPGSSRDSAFRLINGVSIYGGFSGTESSRQARDPGANATVLSGDIGIVNDASDNCYHVFYHPAGTGLDSTAILDGFTITGGNADGAHAHQFGGGMHNAGASPTLANCIFSNNAGESGGGMYNADAAPSLADCIFRDNAAARDGGAIYNSNASPVLANCSFTGNSAAAGGAMFNSFSSPVVAGCIFDGNEAAGGGGMANVAASPRLTGCTFSGNLARDSGGALANYYNSSVPVITNCVFRGNTAGGDGGGLVNQADSAPVLTGCVFTGNTAGAGGGAVANDSASPKIVNCTFSANTAERGGAVANGSGSSPLITSCILSKDAAAGQGAEIFNDDASAPLISYSNVENSGGSGAWGTGLGIDGGGNIDTDPLFVENPGSGSAGDVHLSSGSACIDAGDPDASGQSDFDGDPRIADGDGDGVAVVDMGADEWVDSTDDDTTDDPVPDVTDTGGNGGGGGGGCFISSVLF